MKYRPEIDGLRAIAVMGVILYHANIPIFEKNYFRGGYIGVDIFFVISGYLITSIIINELISSGKFSFKNFYERRIRRIIPPLVFVALISIPFAWIYMPPTHFVEFAKSILYALGFSSNFFFHFSEIQYEAINSTFLPFLHTWSLSIEEQYYLIFPLIFYLIFKNFRNFILVIIILIIILSLLYANYLNKFDQSAAFYSLHTRIWEILIGSLLAYLKIFKKFTIDNKFLNELFSLIGLVLILNFYYNFHNLSYHSIYYTLPPILGTCMIIWSSNEENLIGRILSTKLFVGIGLISYSLYLWHYPIFAFARISGLVSDKIEYKIILGFFLLFISIFSYLFVEKKFRNKKLDFNKVTKILFTSIIFLIFINFIIIYNNGFIDRFNKLKFVNKNYNIDNLYLAKKSVVKNINKKKFNKDKTKIFLIGDSHGENFQTMFITNKSLFSKYDFAKSDEYEISKIKKNLLLEDADIVILAFRWNQNMLNITKKFIVPYLKKINKKIVIISRTNEYNVLSGIYTLIDKEVLFSDNNINYFQLKNKYFNNRNIHSQSEINLKLKKFSKQNNILFLNREDYMCNIKKRECDYLTKDGHKIFYDYGHYTYEGAKYFGNKIYKTKWLKID